MSPITYVTNPLVLEPLSLRYLERFFTLTGPQLMQTLMNTRQECKRKYGEYTT